MDNTHKYDDIIDLPRPVSSRHARMSMVDRGAQFSPFAALTGFDAAIQETGRLTDRQVELTEGSKEALNEKLLLLAQQDRPEVAVTFFQPDQRKLGGAYVRVTGRVRKVDTYQNAIILTDGLAIPFERILEIE